LKYNHLDGELTDDDDDEELNLFAKPEDGAFGADEAAVFEGGVFVSLLGDENELDGY
jgi:hypothetical protein